MPHITFIVPVASNAKIAHQIEPPRIKLAAVYHLKTRPRRCGIDDIYHPKRELNAPVFVTCELAFVCAKLHESMIQHPEQRTEPCENEDGPDDVELPCRVEVNLPYTFDRKVGQINYVEERELDASQKAPRPTPASSVT